MLSNKIITITVAIVFCVCSIGFAEKAKKTDQSTSIKQTQVSDKDQKAAKKAVKEGKKKAKKLLKTVNKKVEQGFEEVNKAIKILESEKPDVAKAIKNLQSATGEFEIAMALDKDLEFAPIDSNIQTYNLVASSDVIKREIAFIKDLLDDGEVQQARKLLMPMRSEVVIETTYLPMLTYPTAIKEAVEELTDGTVKKAKEILVTAENSFVIDTEVLPIPLLAAEDAVEEASKIDKKEKDKILEQLDIAREQLEIANALGYLSRYEEKHNDLQEHIKKLQKAVAGDSNVEKLYKSLKTKIKNIFE